MQWNDDSAPESAPSPIERTVMELESALGARLDAARRHLERPLIRAALMGGLVTVTAASVGVPEVLAAVGASYIALRMARPHRVPPAEAAHATMGALGDALVGIGAGVALSRLLRSRALIGHALGSGYAAYRQFRKKKKNRAPVAKAAPWPMAITGAQKAKGVLPAERNHEIEAGVDGRVEKTDDATSTENKG